MHVYMCAEQLSKIQLFHLSSSYPFFLSIKDALHPKDVFSPKTHSAQVKTAWQGHSVREELNDVRLLRELLRVRAGDRGDTAARTGPPVLM